MARGNARFAKWLQSNSFSGGWQDRAASSRSHTRPGKAPPPPQPFLQIIPLWENQFHVLLLEGESKRKRPPMFPNRFSGVEQKRLGTGRAVFFAANVTG